MLPCAFLAGDHARGAAMIGAVRQAVAAGSGKTLKVILETGELVDLAVIQAAAELAIPPRRRLHRATPPARPPSAPRSAPHVMLQVIHDDPAVGLKPSGGIRTLAEAAAHLARPATIMGPAWASPATFRFGASGLLTALEAAIDGDTTVTGKAAY